MVCVMIVVSKYILVNHEYPFTDKYLFYRWTTDDRRQKQMLMQQTEFERRRSLFDDEYAMQQLKSALVFLSTIGPDAMFRMILQKRFSIINTYRYDIY